MALPLHSLPSLSLCPHLFNGILTTFPAPGAMRVQGRLVVTLQGLWGEHLEALGPRGIPNTGERFLSSLSSSRGRLVQRDQHRGPLLSCPRQSSDLTLRSPHSEKASMGERAQTWSHKTLTLDPGSTTHQHVTLNRKLHSPKPQCLHL